MNRREFMAAGLTLTSLTSLTSWTVLAGAGLSLLGAGCASSARRRGSVAAEPDGPSITDLQQQFESGRLTARSLTARYLERIAAIDRAGPTLNAVLQVNPEALDCATELDKERQRQGSRGPLHGIPLLLKDNIDTHDRMPTTAGSLALAGSIAPRDAVIVERLRAAGAVILGKTNLSEWANFRGSRSISGWSGHGGQTLNPYCTACSPSGSSSGSAAAVSANLCAAAVGTETNGSIVSPSSYCGIVGLKPTVGLASRSGIIPISASQDTAGPLARSVADAALLLGALTGDDPRDPATAASMVPGRARRDYREFLDRAALRGSRLGVPRSLFKLHRRIDPIFERALETVRAAGAELVESIRLPSSQELGGADYQVMLFEFKDGLNAYFASLGPQAPVKSMADLIEFNEKHRDRELAYFGQERLIEAESKGPLSDPAYLRAKDQCRQWSDRLADAMREQRVDAVIAPTTGPAHALDYVHGDRGLGGSSTYAAVAGFPHITLPCGWVDGLPVGISFFGPAWSEPRLLGLAYAFEQLTHARRPPGFRARLGASP